MDTNLLPYRLKSARQKRRLVIKDRDKKLLQLDREYDRINKDSDYQQVVPLAEPYQKGWKRLFVLRAEVQKSDKAEFYQQILNVITHIQYHYDASFKRPKRKQIWHKYYFDALPKLHSINSYDWRINKHQLSNEQRACFKRVDYWSEQFYRWQHRFEFALTDLLEISVRPHIVDTILVGDALLKQQADWIEDKIYYGQLRYRLDKLKKGSVYNGWKNGPEKIKYINPLANKPKWDLEEMKI